MLQSCRVVLGLVILSTGIHLDFFLVIVSIFCLFVCVETQGPGSAAPLKLKLSIKQHCYVGSTTSNTCYNMFIVKVFCCCYDKSLGSTRFKILKVKEHKMKLLK